RAIEAQVEERRQQREREEARRREEEEEEERRVALEREMLQKQYELDTLRERQKEQPSHQAEDPQTGHDDGGLQGQGPALTQPSRRYVRPRALPSCSAEEQTGSRLKRQAGLLALQEGLVCQDRPSSSSAPGSSSLLQPGWTRTSPNRKVETVSRGQNICNPSAMTVPAVRHRVQVSRPPLSSSPVLDFIPMSGPMKSQPGPLEPAQATPTSHRLRCLLPLPPAETPSSTRAA
ncbi:coiled-coil domain-containing protein 66 isoform X2, partial [Lates japonicus]